MLGRRYRLFAIFGFEVGVNPSWLIVAGLVTWTLASGVFPHRFESLSVPTYWLMGAAGSVGLFLSIILHELSHSLLARRVGIEIQGITLFLIGGVAEMEEEPSDPKAELAMAAAGPVASLGLGIGLLMAAAFSSSHDLPLPLVGILEYLGSINILLAVFNMLPAFPLDGGRILRALLWMRRKDVLAATRVAARSGAMFGHAFLALALYHVVRADFVGAMWWAVIAFFIRHASRSSYRQVIVRQALVGEPVRRFMLANPPIIPASITIEEFVRRHVYLRGMHVFPVEWNSLLLGSVSLHQVRAIPRHEWGCRRVGDLVTHCSSENTIDPDADANEAMSMMNRFGINRLLVARHGHLLGIVALKDLVEFLTLRVDLELQRA
jgi:Zn-dependent protease/CBS domain-containing protein